MDLNVIEINEFDFLYHKNRVNRFVSLKWLIKLLHKMFSIDLNGLITN